MLVGHSHFFMILLGYKIKNTNHVANNVADPIVSPSQTIKCVVSALYVIILPCVKLERTMNKINSLCLNRIY